MSDRQIDVTLRSDGAEDSYYFRSITLSDDKPRIDIGRASKRSGGRGPPTMHNAYFTKNVVSREHAALFIKRESKDLWIEDQGSMHGTFINGKRLGHSPRPIQPSDCIQLGSEVLTDSLTHTPVLFKIFYHWRPTGFVSSFRPRTLGDTYLDHFPNSSVGPSCYSPARTTFDYRGLNAMPNAPVRPIPLPSASGGSFEVPNDENSDSHSQLSAPSRERSSSMSSASDYSDDSSDVGSDNEFDDWMRSDRSVKSPGNSVDNPYEINDDEPAAQDGNNSGASQILDLTRSEEDSNGPNGLTGEQKSSLGREELDSNDKTTGDMAPKAATLEKVNETCSATESVQADNSQDMSQVEKENDSSVSQGDAEMDIEEDQSSSASSVNDTATHNRVFTPESSDGQDSMSSPVSQPSPEEVAKGNVPPVNFIAYNANRSPLQSPHPPKQLINSECQYHPYYPVSGIPTGAIRASMWRPSYLTSHISWKGNGGNMSKKDGDSLQEATSSKRAACLPAKNETSSRDTHSASQDVTSMPEKSQFNGHQNAQNSTSDLSRMSIPHLVSHLDEEKRDAQPGIKRKADEIAGDSRSDVPKAASQTVMALRDKQKKLLENFIGREKTTSKYLGVVSDRSEPLTHETDQAESAKPHESTEMSKKPVQSFFDPSKSVTSSNKSGASTSRKRDLESMSTPDVTETTTEPPRKKVRIPIHYSSFLNSPRIPVPSSSKRKEARSNTQRSPSAGFSAATFASGLVLGGIGVFGALVALPESIFLT